MLEHFASVVLYRFWAMLMEAFPSAELLNTGVISAPNLEVLEMRKALSLIAVLALTASACGNGDGGSATTTVAPSTTATTAAPMTTTAVPTTAAPTTTAMPTTTMTAVIDLEAGLFCRDLEPLGYGYSDVVAYWVSEGSPDRMDEDRNGIPCETLYPAADVLAFWGDPLPTTTRPPLTLAQIEAAAFDVWPESGLTRALCTADGTGALGAGSVLTCRPEPVPDGDHAILTALVLDDGGKIAFAEAGVRYVVLDPEIMREQGAGLLCADIIENEVFQRDLVDPEYAYFGALLYWFLEGRPDRMDADGNGIPCETVFPAPDVDAVWDGGLIDKGST